MTHKQKILILLRDGKPHTHKELYQLGCVAHSRVSDLRKDGYQIEQWRENGVYLYRLVGVLKEAADEASPLCASPTVSLSAPATGALDETAGTGSRSAAGASGAVSSSVLIPAVPEAAAEDAHASRGGALSLFDSPRGAYEDAA